MKPLSINCAASNVLFYTLNTLQAYVVYIKFNNSYLLLNLSNTGLFKIKKWFELQ
jgi:hypothetical protein